MTITGAEEIRANLIAFGQRAIPAAASALYQESELIMTDSKDNYVPVDQAVLKNSGHVLEPVIEGTKVLVQMVFGGLAKAYAVIQHERLDFKHRVGGAKYLELPLLKAATTMGSRLAARMRAALHG